jgi:AbrB family looped-hinge helix DNA binding protein
MAIAVVSGKGQITLPAAARRKLGLKPRARVEIEAHDMEIVIRPLRSISDVAGIFRDAAKGKATDWNTIISETERLVAEEVASEGH